jgi:hypothetical protein
MVYLRRIVILNKLQSSRSELVMKYFIALALSLSLSRPESQSIILRNDEMLFMRFLMSCFWVGRCRKLARI